MLKEIDNKMKLFSNLFFVISTVVGTISVAAEPCDGKYGKYDMPACDECAENGPSAVVVIVVLIEEVAVVLLPVVALLIVALVVVVVALVVVINLEQNIRFVLTNFVFYYHYCVLFLHSSFLPSSDFCVTDTYSLRS
jgi:hypothetical protein